MSRKPEPINGYVDGSGNSTFAARADHTHEGMPASPEAGTLLKAVKKTIKASDWNNEAAQVAFTEGVFVFFTPAAASSAAATAAALVLTSVEEGALNFGCTTAPEADLDVYVLYM